MLYAFQKFLLDITGDMPATQNSIEEFEQEANRLGSEARISSDVIVNALPILAPLVNEMMDWHHRKYGSGQKTLYQKREYHERMIEEFTKGWREKDSEISSAFDSIEEFEQEAYDIGAEARRLNQRADPAYSDKFMKLSEKMVKWHRSGFTDQHFQNNNVKFFDRLEQEFRQAWKREDIKLTAKPEPVTIQEFHDEAYRLGAEARKNNKPCGTGNSVEFTNLMSKFKPLHDQPSRPGNAIKLMEAFSKGWHTEHHRITDKELEDIGFWERVKSDKRELPESEKVEKGFTWVAGDGITRKYIAPETHGGKLKLLVQSTDRFGKKSNDFFETYRELRSEIEKDKEDAAIYRKEVEAQTNARKAFFDDVLRRRGAYYGFRDGNPPKSLKSVINILGLKVIKQQFIEEHVIDGGAKVKIRNGERVLYLIQDTSFVTEKELSVTGMDYAQYLCGLYSPHVRNSKV